MFSVLESVDKSKQSKISLHFVTNGSQDLVNAANRLKGYKTVSFSVSLEGIDKTQDFIRTGSDWNLIEKNLLDAKQAGIQVKINYVIQAASIFNVQQLLDWCNLHQLDMTFTMLTYPEYLSFSVLPMSLRELAIQSIKDQSIIDLLSIQPYHPEKFQEFLRFISWHETNSKYKFRDIINFDPNDYIITTNEN